MMAFPEKNPKDVRRINRKEESTLLTLQIMIVSYTVRAQDRGGGVASGSKYQD